jgi:hypothetical protein
VLPDLMDHRQRRDPGKGAQAPCLRHGARAAALRRHHREGETERDRPRTGTPGISTCEQLRFDPNGGMLAPSLPDAIRSTLAKSAKRCRQRKRLEELRHQLQQAEASVAQERSHRADQGCEAREIEEDAQDLAEREIDEPSIDTMTDVFVRWNGHCRKFRKARTARKR